MKYMSAKTWKLKLIGKYPSSVASCPDHSVLPVDEINRDLHRTFPQEKWFENHRERLRNVLLWNAWSDRVVSYAQPFSFIAFTLYYVFQLDEPNSAMVSTYYSLHRLIGVIRPFIPLDESDSKPMKFMNTVTCLLRIHILEIDPFLNSKISPEFMMYIVMNGMPTLFTNWFSVQDSVLVLDYIIDKSKETMFERLLKFPVAIMLTYRPLFVNMEWYKIFLLKQIFSAKTIIARAKSL